MKLNKFFRREWKVKEDQEEDVEEDTITFTLKNTFIFNETLSNGLTGNEEITVAHPLLLVNLIFFLRHFGIVLISKSHRYRAFR